MKMSLEYKNRDSVQQAPRHESQSTKAYPSRTIVRAKLEMTEPGDHDEQEADAVANTVVNGGKIARKISNGGGGSSGIAVSRQMESQLSQLQGGGRQMPEGLRNMMESGFGRDFSQVRLHTDIVAADMSANIHAKAFTHGSDIYFNRGQYNPNTTEGQRLVAHELMHVVQGGRKVGRDDEDKVGRDDEDKENAAKKWIVSGFDPEARFFNRNDSVKDYLHAEVEPHALDIQEQTSRWDYSEEGQPNDNYFEGLERQTPEKSKLFYDSFENANMLVFSGHHYAQYMGPYLFSKGDPHYTFDLQKVAQHEMERRQACFPIFPNVEVVISTSCATICNANSQINKGMEMDGYRTYFPNAIVLGFRKSAPDDPRKYLEYFYKEVQRNGTERDQIVKAWKNAIVQTKARHPGYLAGRQPGIWNLETDVLTYYDDNKWITIKNASFIENNRCRNKLSSHH